MYRIDKKLQIVLTVLALPAIFGGFIAIHEVGHILFARLLGGPCATLIHPPR